MSPGARRGRRGTREPGAERKGPEVDAVQPGGDSGVAGGRNPPGLYQRVESRGLRPVHPRLPPRAVKGGDADLSQDRVRGQVPIEGLPAAQERWVDWMVGVDGLDCGPAAAPPRQAPRVVVGIGQLTVEDLRQRTVEAEPPAAIPATRQMS